MEGGQKAPMGFAVEYKANGLPQFLFHVMPNGLRHYPKTSHSVKHRLRISLFPSVMTTAGEIGHSFYSVQTVLPKANLLYQQQKEQTCATEKLLSRLGYKKRPSLKRGGRTFTNSHALRSNLHFARLRELLYCKVNS